MDWQPDTNETLVIFRKWVGGEIIALFPENDEGFGECTSYEHIGQHAGAHYAGVVASTKPATPEEYADLKRELESYPYGYKLKVRRRWKRRN